jgi:hypothetical protein
MADNLNNIVAPEAKEDLIQLVKDLVAVEKAIESASNKTLSIKIDGDTISGLTKSINEMKVSINELSDVKAKNAQVTETLNAVEARHGETVKATIIAEAQHMESLQKTGSIIAQYNGHSKEFVAVLKQVEAANVQATKAEVEAARVRTESAKQSTEAAKQVTEASKQQTEATKQQTAVTLTDAKANTEAAKSSKELAKAKEIELSYTIKLTKEQERVQGLRDKEQKQLEKQQSAYAQLNAEYNIASKEAQNLGAEYFRLEQRLAALNVQLVSDTNAGLDTDVLKAKIHNLGTEMENLGVRAKSAQNGALSLQKGLLSIDQSIGRSQRNVGNYNSAVFSLSQVLREAPAFAYSFSTGLMGISNNIPILVDEINKLKEANLELTAAGGKAIPIWKTLSTAITSPVGMITIATAAITIFAGRMAMASNETKKAKDALEEYNDELKTFAKNKGLLASNIDAGNKVELVNALTLLDIMQSQKSTVEAKVDSYNKLKAMMPGLLNGFKEEDIINGKSLDSVRQRLVLTSELQNKVRETEKLRDEQQKITSNAKNILSPGARAIVEGSPITSEKTVFQRDAELKELTEYNKQFAELYRLNQQLDQQKKDLAALNSPELPDEKVKKAPKSTEAKDSKAAMEAELKYISDLDEKRNNEAQKTYNNSLKTFDDERKLENDKITIAKETYSIRVGIIEKYHGKVGETQTQYLARLAAALNTEDDILIKSNLTKQKISEEIHKRHLKADADSIKYIETLTKQRQEIEKLSSELEALQASNAAELQGAQFSLFGSAGNQAAAKAAQLQIKIEQAKEAVDRARTNRANEALRTDKPVDPVALGKLGEEELKAQKGLKQAEHEQDLYYANQKKQILEDIKNHTIELAHATMDAVMTMQQRQFDEEAQLLQQRSEREQLAYEQKKEAISATSGFQRDRDNQLAELAAQHAAAQNQIQAQQNELAIRRAKFEKEAAIAGIIVAQAQAQAANLVNFATNPVAAAVIAGIIAATGAVQLAAAAAAPIPQFFKGGTTATEIFSAGEKGTELITEPSGKQYLSGDSATIYKAPIGTKITPHDETMKLIRYAAGNVATNRQDVPQLPAIVFSNKDVVSELKDQTWEISRAIAINAPRPTNSNAMAEELRRQYNLKSK